MVLPLELPHHYVCAVYQEYVHLNRRFPQVHRLRLHRTFPQCRSTTCLWYYDSFLRRQSHSMESFADDACELALHRSVSMEDFCARIPRWVVRVTTLKNVFSRLYRRLYWWNPDSLFLTDREEAVFRRWVEQSQPTSCPQDCRRLKESAANAALRRAPPDKLLEVLRRMSCECRWRPADRQQHLVSLWRSTAEGRRRSPDAL